MYFSIFFNTHSLYKSLNIFFVSFVVLIVSSCSNPQSGPDKTIVGALIGGGWGAGAGAILGNQVNHDAQGTIVGAGYGLIQGALVGGGFDLNESSLLNQKQQLASLKIANEANRRRLSQIQSDLESNGVEANSASSVHQVFFDVDATSLRIGTSANLEKVANAIASNKNAITIHVNGHSDDAGDSEYNMRLSEARARAVTSYLTARGISIDQIQMESFGSTRPIATNSTPVGRQLNRRVDVYSSPFKSRS